MEKFNLENLKVKKGGSGNRYCSGYAMLDQNMEMTASEGGVAGNDPNNVTGLRR